jgi:predicted HTH transcriptional regulator
VIGPARRPPAGMRDDCAMDAERVRRLAADSESEVLELKAGRVRPQDVARNVSAFANTSGGVLIWGVDEREGIVGVAEPARAEALVRRGVERVDPPPDVTVETVDVDGARVIVAEVRKQPGHLHIADGTLFQRVEDRTEPMSADRLQELSATFVREASESEDAAADTTKALLDAVTGLQGEVVALRKQNRLRVRLAIAGAGAALATVGRVVVDML